MNEIIDYDIVETINNLFAELWFEIDELISYVPIDLSNIELSNNEIQNVKNVRSYQFIISKYLEKLTQQSNGRENNLGENNVSE